MNWKLSNRIQYNTVFILKILLFFIFLGIIYLIFYNTPKRKPLDNKSNNSEIYNSALLTPHYPTTTPSVRDYGFGKYSYSSINKNSKFITYLKDNVIYLQNIDNNVLGQQIIVSNDLPIISDYLVTRDKNYLIYSYVKEEVLKSKKNNVEERAHYVDIKNLTTGDIKNLFSYNEEIGKVLSLTLSPVANIIFIGTDNYRLYYYNITTSKLVDITYHSDPPQQKKPNFCVGYEVFDQTPDLNNLLLKELCYEGTVHHLYNPQSQKRILGEYVYVNGRYFDKFIDNGSFIAHDTKDGEITIVGKYNFQNQLVQELPKTEIDDNDPNKINIFDFRQNFHEPYKYFLTSEKEIMSTKGNIDNFIKGKKFLGEDLLMIKVF